MMKRFSALLLLFTLLLPQALYAQRAGVGSPAGVNYDDGRIDAGQLTGLVSRANGGLGIYLADPNVDRILFWDDSAGTYAYLTAGSGLSITGTTLSATGSGGTITTTGSPASGDLTVFSGATSITTGAVTGTGSTFVKQTSPALITPSWSGLASGASLSLSTPMPVASGGTAAATGGEALRNLGAQPREQIVGTRTSLPGANAYSATTQQGNSFFTKHNLPYGGRDIRLVYMGVTTATGGIETASAPIGGLYTSAAIPVAAGSAYSVGDIINPTVASHQIAPTLVVLSAPSGVPQELGVVDPGLFNSCPTTPLATTSPQSGDDVLTVSITCTPIAYGMRVGFAPVFATQSAYSFSSTDGVVPVTKGANYNGLNEIIYVPSGDFVVSDPINTKQLAAGASIGIREDSNGGGLPRTRAGDSSAEVDRGNNFTYWDANTAQGGTYTGTGSSFFVPSLIVGILDTPQPSFVLAGDSLMFGAVSTTAGGTSNDTVDANNNMGWAEKALGIQVAWGNFSTSGDTSATWLGNTGGHDLTWKVIEKYPPSHILDDLSVNDLSGGLAYATFSARKIALWSKFKRIGVKHIWATTLTPYNSTSPFQLSVLPTVSAGGTGCANSSTFTGTITGGTCSVQPTVSLTSNGSGVVTTVNSITDIGVCTVKPTSPSAVTASTCSGTTLVTVMGKCQDVANQVIGSGNTAIQAYNADLLAGTYSAYVDRVINIAANVESSAASGKWAAGLSNDCVHLSVTATNTVAAAHTADFAGIVLSQ